MRGTVSGGTVGLILLGPRRVVLLLVALLGASLALAPRAEAFVYWAGLSTVGRADLDGSNIDPSFMTPVSAGCEGMAVDGGHLYWARWGAPGYIGRANLNGTVVDNTFISGADNPQGVAVDSTHLYWTSWDYPGESDAIERADLDGSNVDPSFIPVAEAPRGVAVNATHIYWSAGDSIGRADLDGSNVDPNFIDPAGDELAVNATHIYWSAGDSIGRANLNGTGVDQSFITVGDSPWGVAADSDHIYWASFGFPFIGSTIGRADLDGSNVDETFIGSADPVIFPCSIAVDARSTPSNDFTFGTVQKNKRDGTAKQQVSAPGPGVLDLAKTRRARADQEAVAARGEGQLIVESRAEGQGAAERRGRGDGQRQGHLHPRRRHPEHQTQEGQADQAVSPRSLRAVGVALRTRSGNFALHAMRNKPRPLKSIRPARASRRRTYPGPGRTGPKRCLWARLSVNARHPRAGLWDRAGSGRAAVIKSSVDPSVPTPLRRRRWSGEHLVSRRPGSP